MAIFLGNNSKVEIVLRWQPELKRDVFVVRVYSEKQTASGPIISQNAIDPKEPNIHVRCMVAAGTLAEHQNQTLGERHDPDECAKAAGKAFSDLCDQMRGTLVRLPK